MKPPKIVHVNGPTRGVTGTNNHYMKKLIKNEGSQQRTPSLARLSARSLASLNVWLKLQLNRIEICQISSTQSATFHGYDRLCLGFIYRRILIIQRFLAQKQSNIQHVWPCLGVHPVCLHAVRSATETFLHDFVKLLLILNLETWIITCSLINEDWGVYSVIWLFIERTVVSLSSP